MTFRLLIMAMCVASVSSATPPVQCLPASTYGAGVGIDNRAAFQLALNAGCLDLRGSPGRYAVTIPSWPRQYATLTMPPGSRIIGDRRETVAFTGNPAGHDWWGLEPLVGPWSVSDLTLSVEEPGGVWDEQSHVIEVVGPVTGGELSNVTFDHPAVAGSKRGDCVRILGRPTARVWDQHIHHVTFKACARSSVAIYGGLHGRPLPPDDIGEIHYTTRIDHTTSLDTRGQDIDMEGGGDPVGGLDASDVVEIDHNTFLQGPHADSALALSIYPGATHLHHNAVTGRGLDVMGGDHEIDHNTITLTTPNGGDPMVYFRKAGRFVVHDETWTRALGAGAGPVFSAAEKLSAPTQVSLIDLGITQHTGAGSIVISGVRAFVMRAVTIADDGPTTMKADGTPTFRDLVRIEGTNVTKVASVVISDSSLNGPVRAAISATGSYKGIGTISVMNNSSTGATQGLRCENVLTTATFGGITGPITYVNNVMPTYACVSSP